MSTILAVSPCPNDTFMFFGLMTGAVHCPGLELEVVLHDIETLNQKALAGEYGVTKLSFHACLQASRYRLLGVGAALGHGCGPVVVARERRDEGDLAGCRVAFPGALTTAHLLYNLWAPPPREKVFVSYADVADLVLRGQVDCGVLIHEGRFVFERAGLEPLVDLGQWWEDTTSLPLPLGGIALRDDLANYRSALEDTLTRSIRYGHEHRAQAVEFAQQYAQELDADVVERHIDTFVTHQSLALDEKGWAAVARMEQLLSVAESRS